MTGPRTLPDGDAARAEAAELLRAGRIVAVPHGPAVSRSRPGRPPRRHRAPVRGQATPAGEGRRGAAGRRGPGGDAGGHDAGGVGAGRERFRPGGLTLVLRVIPSAVLPRGARGRRPHDRGPRPGPRRAAGPRPALGPLPTTSATSRASRTRVTPRRSPRAWATRSRSSSTGARSRGDPRPRSWMAPLDLPAILRVGAIPAALIVGGAGSAPGSAARDRAVGARAGVTPAPPGSPASQDREPAAESGAGNTRSVAEPRSSPGILVSHVAAATVIALPGTDSPGADARTTCA